MIGAICLLNVMSSAARGAAAISTSAPQCRYPRRRRHFSDEKRTRLVPRVRFMDDTISEYERQPAAHHSRRVDQQEAIAVGHSQGQISLGKQVVQFGSRFHTAG